MKQLLTIVAFVFAMQFSYAQDQVELSKNEAKQEYCMVLATQKLLSTKVSISVDFGQEWSFWKDKRSLKDESGKRLRFNSVIDALNYMSSRGWDFVNAYSLTVGQQNVLHYVMKRDLTEEDKTAE